MAARLLRLTLNAHSSLLNIDAYLQLENKENKLIARNFTVRGNNTSNYSEQILSNNLPINEPFQFRVINKESVGLYVSILVIDSFGEIKVLFPNNYDAGEKASLLQAKQTLLIPDPQKDDFQFSADSKGVGEALIIASRSPFKNALLALKNLALEQEKPVRRAIVTSNSDTINDLLFDLGTGATHLKNEQK